ncbi:MAG: DNA-binding protein [Bacteriovoracia bacterium]
MSRSSFYDQTLADELKDKEFAKEFILGLMEDEDGMSLVQALKHTIRKAGVKEFSKMTGIPEKSISRMLNSDLVPKIETLDEYLAPFGLKTKLSVDDIEAA